MSEELQEQYSCSGKNKRESTVAEKVKGSRMEGSVGHQNDSGCRFYSSVVENHSRTWSICDM